MSTVDNEDLVVAFTSKVGCKYDQLSSIWSWINSNQWIIFAFFTVAGGTLCFFGRAMLKPTLFITGILMVVVVTFYIFYTTFLKTNTEMWVGWVVLGCSLLAGMLVGFLFQKFAKVGAFFLAGWGGFSVGLLLYNAFIYKISDEPVVLWATAGVCAIIFGLLTVLLFDHILIQSTAILGSFMFCYGIGLVAGHYPNPFTLAELIKHHQFDQIDPLYYAYLGGNLILYIIGCVVQYRHKRQNPQYNPEDRISFRRKDGSRYWR